MSLVLLGNAQYNRFMDDLVINANLTIPLKEISISFARSGGPGGQHVNKVETKVEARWSVLNSDSLTEENRAWLLKKLANRLTNTGDLVISSSLTRDQSRNRAEALNKLAKTVRGALTKPKKRKATRPSKGAKAKRLQEKKKRGETKQRRSKPDDTD